MLVPVSKPFTSEGCKKDIEFFERVASAGPHGAYMVQRISVTSDRFEATIETAATQMPVLNRIVRWLRSERGVDVGNAQVQAVLLQLVAANVVSSESANAVIAFGTHSVSIAEQQGLGTVGYGAIYNALKEMGIE